MKLLKITLFLIIIMFSNSTSNPVSLFSTGIGSWMVLGKEENSGNHYYNKLYVNSYLNLGPLKGYIGIPLQLVIEDSQKFKRAVAPGNLNFWIGKKILIIEPRIGFLVRMYPTGSKYPWFGDGNIRIQGGFGLNSNVREEKNINASGEIMFNIAIADFENAENPAYAKNGSFSVLPSFKLSWRPVDKIKTGIEVLGSFQYSKWIWEKHIELKAGIVPNIFGEFFIREKFAISTKFGFGPSFKRAPLKDSFSYKANSINTSIGINFYP